MKGLDGRGRWALAALIAACLISGCGARDWRRALLRSGAVNISEAVSDAAGGAVSVLEASFSPDSSRILVHALSLAGGGSSLWVYAIESGSLVETGLKPGWTLTTACFTASSDRLLLATERPDPPTYRIYETGIGSTDWANLTDLVPASYVKVVKMAPSPDGETVAVLSVGEGHGDVVVSRAGDILHETQAYPGYVSILGWDVKGEVLYLESDMPLDLGLTMEAREKNLSWDESMREGGKPRVFALDVEGGSAVAVTAGEAADPTVSPDGRWKIHLAPDAEGTSWLFLTPR